MLEYLLIHESKLSVVLKRSLSSKWSLIKVGLNRSFSGLRTHCSSSLQQGQLPDILMMSVRSRSAN